MKSLKSSDGKHVKKTLKKSYDIILIKKKQKNNILVLIKKYQVPEEQMKDKNK